MNQKTNIKKLFVGAVSVFLCAAAFFSLTGCGREEKNNKGYYIYCLDTNETRVEGEAYSPKNKDTQALIREFLQRMDREPQNISLKKAIPDNVTLEKFTLSESGDLCLSWTSSYGNYTGISEILRRAAIVKTLCQIPAVNTVEFFVAGQPLTDSNLNAVGFMTAETFIDNTGAETYTQTAALTVYFSNKSGTKLKKVPVEITYDAAIPLEQQAVEQLIAGPGAMKDISDSDLLGTIPKGTKINKVSVKENTCYLDLTDEFLKKPAEISENVAIYSVVNTLTELPNINKVQFSIDGEQVMLYNEYVGFGEPFEANLDIVQ